MRIFITGPTGYIGSAIARRAASEGHEVLGLAHRDRAARELEGLGYSAVPGDIRQPEGFLEALEQVDAVVHAANTGGDDVPVVDERAVKAMIGALEGSNKPFIYTSGVWVLGATGEQAADEGSAPAPVELVAWREGLEAWVIGASNRGVRTVVIRPGVVYGDGGGIPGMMARGELPVVGDGSQRWAMVHVDDLADLYLAALGRASAGSILHGVAVEATANEVAQSVSESEPVRVPLEEARQTIGVFAEALALDQRVSSSHTRAQVGWAPRRPSVVAHAHMR